MPKKTKVKRTHQVGKCSHCGSENLEYEAIVLDGDMAGYPVTCKDCGAEGSEWYNLNYCETVMERG
jgi:transcription elongation factor Elf1